MDFEILELYNNTEELNNYGNDFKKELIAYYREEAITYSDFKKIIDCLLEIDEIRDTYTESIKNLIKYVVGKKQSIDLLIEFLVCYNNKSSDLQLNCSIFDNICNSIYSESLTIGEAIGRLRRCN